MVGDHGFGVLAGDYYARVEDVKRGCSLDCTDWVSTESLADVRPENCSVWSLTMPAPPPLPLLRHTSTGDDEDGGHQAIHPGFVQGCVASTESDAMDLSVEPNFYETQQPPEVPFGGCACTSLLFDHVDAADAMKALYDFFTTHVAACVLKVRLNKGWIKASAFCEEDCVFSQCTLKVRLFAQANSGSSQKQTVVEFRRSHGDSIAFVWIFSRAVDYLAERFGSDRVTRVDMQTTPKGNILDGPSRGSSVVLPTSALEARDLHPIVDMLRHEQSPASQSEALTTLAMLARESVMMASIVAAALSGLQDTLLQCRTSPVFSVSYPATLLTTRLSQCNR